MEHDETKAGSAAISAIGFVWSTQDQSMKKYMSLQFRVTYSFKNPLRCVCLRLWSSRIFLMISGTRRQIGGNGVSQPRSPPLSISSIRSGPALPSTLSPRRPLRSFLRASLLSSPKRALRCSVLHLIHFIHSMRSRALSLDPLSGIPT